MNILEAVRRCDDERGVLEARLKGYREELEALLSSLVGDYGDNWEERYQYAVGLLEEWEREASAQERAVLA